MSLAKDCLFCGALFVTLDSVNDASHYVECIDCHARGPVSLTPDMALFAWNERRGQGHRGVLLTPAQQGQLFPVIS